MPPKASPISLSLTQESHQPSVIDTQTSHFWAKGRKKSILKASQLKVRYTLLHLSFDDFLEGSYIQQVLLWEKGSGVRAKESILPSEKPQST